MAELRRTAGGVPVRLSLDELQGSYGSDPADQALVADVLTGLGLGLEVTSSDPGSRRLTVAGPVSALARAFGTTLSLVTSEGHGQAGPVTHRCREGGLQVPAELAGIVVAVLGLDSRPQARSQLRRRDHAAAQTVSYTPPEVAAFYAFPGGADGTGQAIAIIEFGGGFAESNPKIGHSPGTPPSRRGAPLPEGLSVSQSPVAPRRATAVSCPGFSCRYGAAQRYQGLTR